MLAAEDEVSSTLPPQGVDPQGNSPTSHSSESPIKRRAQSKKSRQSLAPASNQPLGSIPEHEQPPATLADLASSTAQRQEAPVRRNPETPPDHPGSMQERPHAMTEIDMPVIKSMQNEEALLPLISSWNLSREPRRHYTTIKVPLEQPEKLTDKVCCSPHCRSTVTCPGNGRWRGLQSPKQINRLVRTFLWRQVTEKALHGSSFGDIPEEINQAYIGDLHPYK